MRLLSDKARVEDLELKLGDTECRFGARLGVTCGVTLDDRERDNDALEEVLETVGLEELLLERIAEDDLELLEESELDDRVTLLDPDELREGETSTLGVLLGRTGETEGLVELDRVEDGVEERERE